MKLTKFIFIVFLSLSLFLNYSCDNNDDDKVKLDIELTNSYSYYQDKQYVDVYNEFKRMGFKYIEYSIIYDLEDDSKDFGNVYSVSINKETNFKKGDSYSKFAKIVITYHSLISKDPNNSPIEDTYDIFYNGDTYRVNFVIDFNTSESTNKYKMDFRVDGHLFSEVFYGMQNDFELDLKPGHHIISFTKDEDLGIYGKIELNIDDDMMVNYTVTAQVLEINIEETNVFKDVYCVINFDSSGGDHLKPYKIKKGQTIYDLSIPTGMDDYRFKGWEIAPNTKITYPYVINTDISLKASWKPKSDYVYELCFKNIDEYGINYILIDLDTSKVLDVDVSTDSVRTGVFKSGSNVGGLISYDGMIDYTVEYISNKEVAIYVPIIIFPGQTTFPKTIYQIVDSEEAENYLIDIGYLRK